MQNQRSWMIPGLCICLLTLLFGNTGICTPAYGQDLRQNVLEDLLNESTLVVWGYVARTDANWRYDERGAHIYTTVRITPLATALGGWPEEPLVFDIIGGTVEEITETVSNTPTFYPGEEVIVFVTGHPIALVSGPFSKLEVTDGKVQWGGITYTVQQFVKGLDSLSAGLPPEAVWKSDTRAKTLKAAPGAPVITGISPSTASVGTQTEVTISGSHFGATQGSGKVEFTYRPGSKLTAPIVFWSDNQIRCRIPGDTRGSTAASSGPVTVTTSNGTSNDNVIFRATFSYGQVKWPGLSPTVPYWINENTTDCDGEGSAVRSAASSWNSAGPLSFQYMGTHSATSASRNYKNEIMWGSTSYAAVATVWSNTATKEIVECDLVFNDSYTWSTSGSPPSGTLDIQSVALHELGHWLNLRDLYGDTGDGYDTAKVMYGISMMGTTKRYLHASDKAGVQWIYSSSSSCTTPFAPSNVNASDGTYCDKVEITWSYASGATGYEIWRATSSNPAYAAKLADDTASPYHDTSAAVGTTYYYWIKATSACGTSSFSAPNTGYRSSTANPPSSVNATDGTYCDYIQVSWSSVPGATAYEIWRSTGSSSASAVHIADDTSSPYDDTSAVTGTTYYYWVKTQSTCGTSGFSTFNTGYCADTPAPPANVVASDGTYCDNVHITWDAVLGATAYEIWRSTGSSSASAVKIADDTSSPYDDTSAVTGTTYYYWIKAKNTCDTSLFSNPDSGYRPAQTTPPAPTGVSATDGICDKIQLRWDPVPNAVGYEIWQGTSSNSVFAAKIADVTVTSYNHYSATPGMTYYYWVKTKNACSTSPFSDGDTGYRAGAPAAPTYVSASDGTSTQSIRINWNTVSGATGYEIWRGTSDNPPLAVKIADDTAPPYSDYSAVGGTLYYYWIKARNVCGVSDFSDSNTGYFIEYSLVLSSSAGGSIANPGEGTLRYAPGTSITIQAAPDVGYRFGSWTGTAVDTGNVADPNASEITITVNSDYSLKAVFLSLLDEIHVDDNAPLDPAPHTSLVSDPHENGTPEHPYDSLQKAIEVAAEGSRVVIGSGTYAGPLDLMGKAIEVTGADPNNPDISAWPVIDAQGMEPVVSFTQGEDPNTILRGLVLTGGVGQKAGAINCINSSPFITNCLIVGNRTMDTNGGAVYCQNSNAVLTNCTIAHNYSGPGGAGLYVVDSQVIVLNSIIWGNQAHQILAPLGPLPLVYYSDIEGGWSGTGNLDLDPLFVLPGYWADVTDPAIWVDPSDPRAFWVNDGDYHLKPQSPCIDAGDPNLPVGAEPEPNGGLINMGAYGGTSQATLSGD